MRCREGKYFVLYPHLPAIELKQQLAQAPSPSHHMPLSSFLLPAPILHALCVSFPGPSCLSISETKGSRDRWGFEKKCLDEEQLQRVRRTGEKPLDDRSRLLVCRREAGREEVVWYLQKDRGIGWVKEDPQGRSL